MLLLAHAAHAAELKLATWNLEWLTLRAPGDKALPEDVVPKQADDLAALRRYALLLNADVVAFQEVDGPAAAAAVFPPDRYAIYLTGDRVVQRVGFAVRRGIEVQQNPDLKALDVQPDAPFPLRSGADITLILGGARLRLLAVHLKSGCFDQRLANNGHVCATLRQQIPPLQGWLAQRQAEGAPFVVLGDFNRRMDHADELLDSLAQSAPLLRATEGRASPCWGGESFIDHVLAGGAARGWVEPGSLRVLVYRETDAVAKAHLSDHCPVSVKLQLPD